MRRGILNGVFTATAFAAMAVSIIPGTALAIEVTRTPTGVLLHDEVNAQAGYTLLQTSPDVLLIDLNGNVVHRWTTGPGGDAQLTKDGTLLRISSCAANDSCDGNPLNWGGAGGRLREWTWDGELIWDIDLARPDKIAHHSYHRMPNGNTLLVVWERYSRKAAIKKGRDPATVNPEGAVGTEPRPGVYVGDFWPDMIVEIRKPKGGGIHDFEIVWHWRAWDHVCDKKRVGCLDINYHIPRPTDQTHRSSADYMHVNSVDYDEVNDVVIINSRVFGEFYVIDHKTGKILYRWGNPSAWDETAVAPSYMEDGDTYLFGSHGATVVDSEPGFLKVVVFDNGWLRPSGSRSRALEVDVKLYDKEFRMAPNPPVWSFQTGSSNSLNSPFVSYAQRLDNGNTLLTSGMENHLIEVTRDGEYVWEYVIPFFREGPEACQNIDGVGGGFVFRTYRYPTGYEGLRGLTEMTPYPDCP